jgi:hypothetical protein
MDIGDRAPRGLETNERADPAPFPAEGAAMASADREPDPGPDSAKAGSALAKALVVLCIEHLKAHGRLEKEGVLTAFNNATGSSVGPIRSEIQAEVWAEVQRQLEETEGIDLVAVERAFFASPEGNAEGPIENETAAKYVVGGMASEDLSREDEVAGFAVVKPETD